MAEQAAVTLPQISNEMMASDGRDSTANQASGHSKGWAHSVNQRAALVRFLQCRKLLAMAAAERDLLA